MLIIRSNWIWHITLEQLSLFMFIWPRIYLLLNAQSNLRKRKNNLASEKYTTGSDRQYCEIYYHQQNQGYSFRKKSQISIYFEIVDGSNPRNYNLHKNHFSY